MALKVRPLGGATAAKMTPADHLALLRAPKVSPQSGTDPVKIFEGRMSPPASQFDKAYAAFPPPRRPETYDYRGAHGRSEPVALSRLGPQDRLMTDGADVRMSPEGPVITLRQGYGDGRSAARSGPVLVPPGPPDVRVDSNIEIARGESAKNPFGAALWFRRVVPNGAPWDFKQQGKQYEAFGNFNFGATGRKVGFPTTILEQEAGRAQQRDHTWRPEFGRPGPHLAPFLGTGSFGDDPTDQFWIGEGARYFDER